jgi:hypothetical protein
MVANAKVGFIHAYCNIDRFSARKVNGSDISTGGKT